MISLRKDSRGHTIWTRMLLKLLMNKSRSNKSCRRRISKCRLKRIAHVKQRIQVVKHRTRTLKTLRTHLLSLRNVEAKPMVDHVKLPLIGNNQTIKTHPNQIPSQIFSKTNIIKMGLVCVWRISKFKTNRSRELKGSSRIVSIIKWQKELTQITTERKVMRKKYTKRI